MSFSDKPAFAIDKLNLKQKLLDKVLSEEEGDIGSNETLAAETQKIADVRDSVSKLKDNVLEEARLTLSKDEAKQVNQDDNKILSMHASQTDSNCRGGNVRCVE